MTSDPQAGRPAVSVYLTRADFPCVFAGQARSVLSIPSRSDVRESLGGLRAVHLLGGLPTDGVRRGLDRVRGVLNIRSLTEFVELDESDWVEVGVVLPPYVETSVVVEEWEACDFLAERIGEGARIGNVVTLVDTEVARGQLASGVPISARGWGKGRGDARSVADIVAGQIESATRLVLVGDASSESELLRVLHALNPSAEMLGLDAASDVDLRDFVSCSRRSAERGCCVDSARVVPPWLELLQTEDDPPVTPDRLMYRRSLPFDPDRFSKWFADPPPGIVRGKGKVWLANHNDHSVGYSCAGAVHRVFPAARWWASCSGPTWPICPADRRRLLELWHPHFGDRRQELAFVGVDLDRDAIVASLDRCLIPEDEALIAFRLSSDGMSSAPGATPGSPLN